MRACAIFAGRDEDTGSDASLAAKVAASMQLSGATISTEPERDATASAIALWSASNDAVTNDAVHRQRPNLLNPSTGIRRSTVNARRSFDNDPDEGR
jgi:hypothetical protein